MPVEILRVGMPLVCSYLLRDGDGLYMVDAGFVGARGAVRRALRRAGWDDLPLRGILLTHGHLDHTLNAAWLQGETGAWVAAPRGDRRLVAGDYRCGGWGRVGAWLQRIGGGLLRYAPPRDVRWFEPDARFEICGGLRVVPLPGHTAGHAGLLAERWNLLFSGDLFASYRWLPHLPPAIFNEDGGQIPNTIRYALSLGVDGMLPGHGDRASAAEHLARLQKLAGRHSRSS